MMTPRENMMAIFNRQQPDYYGDIMDAIELLPDPLLMGSIVPQDGEEHKDQWGVTWCFKPGAPGQHPVINDSNRVLTDIEKWEEQVTFPSLEGLDWTLAKQVEAGVDRKEKFVGIMFAGGLFERSHFLMGMAEAMMAYIEDPDEMKALLRKIADWKIEYIRQMAREVHPDIIFYHDDWGSKTNVFLPPRVWRDIIKPLQTEIAEVIHECGMIYMHHSDCICQPYVVDMVEIGIDIWQGVIAQNDIKEIQRVTEGKLALVGGVDGPAIDLPSVSDETIREEVHRVIDNFCPAGRFFPGIPNGICFNERNNTVYRDEMTKYGRIFAEEHPVVDGKIS